MKRKETGDHFLFELAMFMATSARNVEDMPQYGSSRFITALSKVIDLPKCIPDLKEDELFERVRKEIDDKKYLFLSDRDAYIKFLDDLVALFYERALRLKL